MDGRYVGIDFSGGARPWRAFAGTPTVWLATARKAAERLELTTLVPVQALAGDGECFSRLVVFLSRGDYVSAGIDAPFSLPERHIPERRHDALIEAVAALPNAADRPFPNGRALLDLAQTVKPLTTQKPLRATEAMWRARSVNTRSTLWNGPRGGAPLASACMALLSRSGRPCWPWVDPVAGMLVEVFPAAQLRTWGLPHQGYSGEKGGESRRLIVDGVAKKISLSIGHRDLISQCPDALDAVIAVFGALAATESRQQLPVEFSPEGWISVHP